MCKLACAFDCVQRRVCLCVLEMCWCKCVFARDICGVVFCLYVLVWEYVWVCGLGCFCSICGLVSLCMCVLVCDEPNFDSFAIACGYVCVCL